MHIYIYIYIHTHIWTAGVDGTDASTATDPGDRLRSTSLGATPWPTYC